MPSLRSTVTRLPFHRWQCRVCQPISYLTILGTANGAFNEKTRYPDRLFTWLIQLTGLSRAYIPAQPSNESSLVQSGVNDTQQMSILELQWFPKSSVAGVSAYRFQSSDMQGYGGGGSFPQEVLYALTGTDSTGVDKVSHTRAHQFSVMLRAISSVFHSGCSRPLLGSFECHKHY